MAFYTRDAVELICTKLRDPNFEVYCNDYVNGGAYKYDGIAKTEFWNALYSLIDKGDWKREELRELVHVEKLNIDIATMSINIPITTDKDIANFIDLYPDPMDLSHVEKNLKRCSPAIFAGFQGQGFGNGNELLWWQQGTTIVFWTSDVNGLEANRTGLMVTYVEYPTITAGNEDIGIDLTQLVTYPFILKAVAIAVATITQQRIAE